MTIPTLSDWGEIDKDDLDAQGALKQFLGKSFLDAEALFAENALYYGEDLQSMPTAVFNFYAPALARYLTSDKSRGDCDGASSYLQTLIWILKTRPEIVAPETKIVLLDAAKHVAAHQPFYDADASIYGWFPNLNDEIALLGEACGPAANPL